MKMVDSKQYDATGGGWTTKLANAIKDAADGDSIQVESEAGVELGRGALARMCPEKKLSFVVKPFERKGGA